MTAPESFGPKSLSGVPLEGDRLVRLVYVDEAGISRADQEPFLVVAAVIVDADKKLTAIQRQLDRIVKKHIPEPYRDRFVFHAHEIFSGRGKVFDSKTDPKNPRWAPDRRLAIADDLAQVPKKFALPISFGVVERATFPFHESAKAHFALQSRAQQVVISHVTAFMSCAIGVDQWMRANAPGEFCLMIVEDNEQARTLIKNTQIAHQDDRLIANMTDEERRYFPLRRIKEDPLFQEKRVSSVLQVADFCAYVLKKLFMGDKTYGTRFSGPILPLVSREAPKALKRKTS